MTTTPQQPPRTATAQDICDELDISNSTLKRYCAIGLPCTRGGRGVPNRFDSAEVASWMKGQGLTGKPHEHRDDTDLNSARLRKENAMAHNWELRNGELERRLIDVDQHLDIVRNIVGVAANQLASLPSAIAPSLVGMNAGEIQDELESQIRLMREGLADESRYTPA